MPEPPFDTADKVRKALRFCYAFEAAMHPVIRSFFRDNFRHKAFLTVRPTRLGFQTIEPWDTLAKYRFITKKPV